ncbi:MAG TPA: UDP-N-acetylmuramoyl-L-alanyl-D-glutamate--2,6-diaminopimelate ligase [Candidatus Krumholzibacteria bacterium]|jgi:UDP-N-acetylmuramoyl-L-alanyl-D-glutamate--2,6-diaminopimelate ligase
MRNRLCIEDLLPHGLRRIRGESDPELRGITADSRRVESGDLFVALRGQAHDGLAHIPEALRRGAAAVVCEFDLATQLADDTGVLYGADDPRAILGVGVRRVHDAPDRKLQLFAVTGTNGKTTVTHLLRDLLHAMGTRCGLLGTIRYDTGKRERPAPLTTPGVEDFYALLAEMVDAGLTACAFEASSHALDQQRLGPCEVDTAVFMNLEPEHLDYHVDLRGYLEAKRKLLVLLGGASKRAKAAGRCVVNADCAAFAAVEWPSPTTFFGAASRADFRRDTVRCDRDGIRFRLRAGDREQEIRSDLLGPYNVENLHAALAAVLPMVDSWEELATTARMTRPVAGRMEAVELPGGPLVVLDYAHTAEAIRAAIEACRSFHDGRIAIVFGCGGDRDRSKRAPMAKSAVEGADLAVLTLDNPRGEDPRQIFADALLGFQESIAEKRGVLIEDRGDALRHALQWSTSADLILVTGKGHERYQIIKDRREPWDDGERLRELWQGMEAGA